MGQQGRINADVSSIFKTVHFTRRPLQDDSKSGKSTNEFDAGGTLVGRWGNILLLTIALKSVYIFEL